MSIWGKRVDSWFTGNRQPSTQADYNRMGLQTLLPILAVLIFAVIVVAIALNVD